MLEIRSAHKLEEMEAAMRRAAQRQGAALLAVSHMRDVVVFTICHAGMNAALLEADVRLASFLPCRVAAWAEGDGARLQAVPPREFARMLNRPDLEPLVEPLEALLQAILEDAAQPAAAAHHAAQAMHAGLGATEEQVNPRASIPQRIDCKGSKVEDLAGTGQHDAAGG